MRKLLSVVVAFSAISAASAQGFSPGGEVLPFPPYGAESNHAVGPDAMFGPTEASQRTAKAGALLVAKDYAGAEAVLAPLLSNGPVNSEILFLSGLARAGTGDLPLARDRFRRSLRQNRNHIGSRSALAIVLARLGDRVGAAAQLGSLEQRRANCGNGCRTAAQLDGAIASIRRNLA